MHKFIFLLLMIFFSFHVQAKEITLGPDQSYLFKGVNISLINVGQKGSVALQIGDEKSQTIQTSLEAEGIRVEIINTQYSIQRKERFATLSITQIADCLTNEDCKDNNPCSRDICSLKKCYNIKEKGCTYKDKCIDQKEEVGINQKIFYCGEDNELHEKYTEEIPTTFAVKETKESSIKPLILFSGTILIILETIFFIRKKLT